MVPQKELPPLPQVSRVHPDWTHTPLVQVSPEGQLPQSSECPQLSPIVPQNWVVPDWQEIGVHVVSPTHRPLWQLQPVMHEGHAILPPHPSPIVPQYCPPSGVHVTPPHASALVCASMPMRGPEPEPSPRLESSEEAAPPPSGCELDAAASLSAGLTPGFTDRAQLQLITASVGQNPATANKRTTRLQTDVLCCERKRISR
jgi:hypothetical protein